MPPHHQAITAPYREGHLHASHQIYCCALTAVSRYYHYFVSGTKFSGLGQYNCTTISVRNVATDHNEDPPKDHLTSLRDRHPHTTIYGQYIQYICTQRRNIRYNYRYAHALRIHPVPPTGWQFPAPHVCMHPASASAWASTRNWKSA